MIKKFFCSLILTLFLIKPVFSEGDKVIYSLFLTPDDGVSVYLELTKYINKKLGLNLKSEMITDYHQAGYMIFKKEALFGFLCSGPYTALRDKYNFEILAAIKPSQNREYRSYLIVPKDSKAKSLVDLKTKSFAYVDLLSYTGRVTTIYDLLKLKEDPLNFFSKTIYSKTHINSIDLVAQKKVDGASVMSIIFENVVKKKPEILSMVKVIDKSQRGGFPVFVTSKYNDAKIKEDIKQVLLNMHKDPEGKKILNALEIDYLFIPDLSDYKIIEKQLKDTKDYIPY